MRGETATSIAAEFNLKIDALLRHKARHLSKASEASTTSAMLRQVIAELDDAALTALSRGDHRAAIDARKRKADAIQTLAEIEQTEAKAASNKVTDGGLQRIPFQVLDAIVNQVMESHDPCPLCAGHTMPKATRQITRQPLN